jgi:ribulose-bisphosphate carboxylase large chain
MRVENTDLDLMRTDLDVREEVIRKAVYEGFTLLPQIDTKDQIVGTYFLNATNGKNLVTAAEDIASHQTTAIHGAKEGSLVARCTGHLIDTLPFDDEGKTGLIRIGFPTMIMITTEAGKDTIYSTDIMHILSGAVQHEFRANNDIKLVKVDMSEEVMNMFPGPRYGPAGLREMAGLEDDKFMFGTIVKPCTGITAEEVAAIIGTASANPFFSFVKEDENFHPSAKFAPLAERVRLSAKAIQEAQKERGKGKIIYAPHITSSRKEFENNLRTAAKEGATAVMFSETYVGGAYRFARDLMADWERPLAIYGHNGGIGSKGRAIYREVIDLFARLDGIDFRQTAPTGAMAYLRPTGLEFEMSEKTLTMPLGKHKPVMATRAGGLDQGNIIINLQDIKDKGLDPRNYHFMAGSAINGWKNPDGSYNPKNGAKAMEQAVFAFNDSSFDNSPEDHVRRLHQYAGDKGFLELKIALEQRYAL